MSITSGCPNSRRNASFQCTVARWTFRAWLQFCFLKCSLFRGTIWKVLATLKAVLRHEFWQPLVHQPTVLKKYILQNSENHNQLSPPDEEELERFEMTRLAFPVLLRYFHSIEVDSSAIWERMKDVLAKNWHLGVTAFGGPPLHFQIVSRDWIALYLL